MQTTPLMQEPTYHVLREDRIERIQLKGFEARLRIPTRCEEQDHTAIHNRFAATIYHTEEEAALPRSLHMMKSVSGTN